MMILCIERTVRLLFNELADDVIPFGIVGKLRKQGSEQDSL